MKGGMALKETDIVGAKDAQRQAEDAESAFRDAEDDIGVGETLFLQALISATDPERKKFAPMAFEEAKAKFPRKTYAVGVARADIAEAAFLLEDVVGDDTSTIEALLEDALKILEANQYFDNMEAECYYFKAMCAEKHKDYNRLREHLLISLEKCRCVGNKALENKCVTMLNHSSTCMQQDYPLFSFLKAYPLVRRVKPPKEKEKDKEKEVLQALEPYVRKQTYFHSIILSHFESKHVAAKAHFDTLTKESLKQSLMRSCVVLHVSSDFGVPGIVSLEGAMGELEQVPLDDFKKLLRDPIRTSQCKLVAVFMPRGLEIAQAFVDLGVPHVVYYNFESANLNAYKDRIPIGLVNQAAALSFSTEFHKNLIGGETVYLACEKARKTMVDAVQTRMEQFGIKDFTLSIDAGPALLPHDHEGVLHDVKILPALKTGKFIETSPKRGICDIEHDRKALVGRQLELFKIVQELKTNNCVNIYGRHGVGKTKLAHEIGYFMYMRSYFQAGIYYRADMKKIHNPKYFVPLEEDSYRMEKYSVLFIVDNLDVGIWKKELHFFRTLREERKYVFLFVSQGPLDSPTDFDIKNVKLKPFLDDISLEYVMYYLDYTKYMMSKQAVKNIQGRAELRNSIASSQGFRQAHGNPRLLDIFCDLVIETGDVSKINLLTEPKVDLALKRAIRNHETAVAAASMKLEVPVMQHMHSQQVSSRHRTIDTAPMINISNVRKAEKEKKEEDEDSAFINPRTSVYIRPIQEPATIQLQNMRTEYVKQNSRPIQDLTSSQIDTIRQGERELLSKQPSLELEAETEEDKQRDRRLLQAFTRAVSIPADNEGMFGGLQNARSEMLLSQEQSPMLHMEEGSSVLPIESAGGQSGESKGTAKEEEEFEDEEEEDSNLIDQALKRQSKGEERRSNDVDKKSGKGKGRGRMPRRSAYKKKKPKTKHMDLLDQIINKGQSCVLLTQTRSNTAANP